MATISSCPSCGESERLRGRTVDADIEVTCESCGARWMRGGPRCSQCGGAEVVTRPQVMTRQPRGNQLAIVGRRQLPLCPVCDADAVAGSTSGNRPVPEGYVSAFLFGRQEAVTARSGGIDERRPFAVYCFFHSRSGAERGPPAGGAATRARPSPANLITAGQSADAQPTDRPPGRRSVPEQQPGRRQPRDGAARPAPRSEHTTG